MDLNKILLACDARAFSQALGEYMEARARKAIDLSKRLLDAEEYLHEEFELYLDNTTTPSRIGWQDYIAINAEDIMRQINTFHFSQEELEQKYFKIKLDETQPLTAFLTQTLAEEWNEYQYGEFSDSDNFQSLASTLMNSAYSCLAEGAAYRTLSILDSMNTQAAVSIFHTLVDSSLNAANTIVSSLKNNIVTKLQNSNNVVDYVTQTQASESFTTTPLESLAYQYTGAHPIMAYSIDCNSVLSGLITSWNFVFNFYGGLFRTFISVGKKVITQVYNFLSSILVDPACVSYNNNGSAYTFDNFYTEESVVVTNSSGEIYRWNTLVSELEKGPISINLATSENVIFLDTNADGKKVIVRRFKQKLVGELKGVINSVIQDNAENYSDQEVTTLIEKAIPCIDPASVSSSTGRLMLQSFYQSAYLEYFVLRYLAICYGFTSAGYAVNPYTWKQFKDKFLGLDNLGSNKKYFKFASEGAMYDATTNDYSIYSTQISWISIMYPLIDAVLAKQNIANDAMEGAFFPYSHNIVNFKSSKLVILTDEEVADAWMNKVTTAVVVIAASALLVKSMLSFKKALFNNSIKKEAYFYQMQSEIQNTGSYTKDTYMKYKTARRNTNILQAIGGGIAKAGDIATDSSPDIQADILKVIRLINPSAI